MRRVTPWLVAIGLLVVLLLGVPAACGGPAEPGERPVPAASPEASTPSPAPEPAARAGASPRPPAPGTIPPAWLGTRVLPITDGGFGQVRRTPRALRTRRFTQPDEVRPLPGKGFASRIVSPPPRPVLDRSTWRPVCPVARDDLAWLRLTFWGFDDRRHTGELLVHETAAADLAWVFRRLYRLRFPIEELTITTRAELDAPPTGDGNSTTAFVCRPITGGTSYSQHAYGLAIDVNSFQNPYQSDDLVLPELAGSYLDRADVRPGMITAGSPVVRAFAAIGWEWGGGWRTLKDYQHFSRSGT